MALWDCTFRLCAWFGGYQAAALTLHVTVRVCPRCRAGIAPRPVDAQLCPSCGKRSQYCACPPARPRQPGLFGDGGAAA
ncbi:MAG TPA: hypothetical protein VF017_15410 [Thermoanaerobaculia bacterium]|nr:hypothetical protein [Thermoanaerobaculia bacterium]